jgi:hypothetical protein
MFLKVMASVLALVCLLHTFRHCRADNCYIYIGKELIFTIIMRPAITYLLKVYCGPLVFWGWTALI